VHFLQFGGDLLHPVAVHAKALPGRQGLAGKLQQDAFEDWSRRGHSQSFEFLVSSFKRFLQLET
jgi:hypothetical protein